MATQLYSVDPDAVNMILYHLDWVLEGFDLASVLQRVTHPTLILRGEQRLGSVVGDEDVDFVHTYLPSAVIVNILNAGHDPDVAQTDMVLQHIDSFLQSV